MRFLISRTIRRTLLSLLAVGLTLPASAAAQSYQVLVAPRDSDALAHAEAQADGEAIFAERRLFRALNRAADLMNATPGAVVEIRVAAGQYPGQRNQGVFVVPAMDNPTGTLRILGGFSPDFSARQPFANLVELVTIEGRLCRVPYPNAPHRPVRNRRLERSHLSSIHRPLAP